MSEKDFEAAVQKSLTIIKQALIATKSLKPPEATEILTLLGGTTLTSGSLAALAREILAKVGITRGRPVASPSRQFQQSCLYLHNLLGEHQWEKIVQSCYIGIRRRTILLRLWMLLDCKMPVKDPRHLSHAFSSWPPAVKKPSLSTRWNSLRRGPRWLRR